MKRIITDPNRGVTEMLEGMAKANPGIRYLGEGMLDAAVCGHISPSPSPDRIIGGLRPRTRARMLPAAWRP